MQSRLEEEEEAKAALMSRIQRLTKLILVSTKNTIPGLSDVPNHQRSHSVGEDDVSCYTLWNKKCGLSISFFNSLQKAGALIKVLNTNKFKRDSNMGGIHCAFLLSETYSCR